MDGFSKIHTSGGVLEAALGVAFSYYLSGSDPNALLLFAEGTGVNPSYGEPIEFVHIL